MAEPLPLHGLRVLELGHMVAGPYAGLLLGEFGAEVIKAEPPGLGDPLRNWRTRDESGTSLWWYVQARNKKSITLDLRKAEGQAIARRLASVVDVVVENFRAGTLEKWGLGWDALHTENPRLIMLRISGYGQSGPYRDKPALGSIGETMGGLRYLTGWPDQPPPRVGLSLGDTAAALYGMIGLLIALHHRSATGRGQYVDIALYEAVFALTESVVSEYDRFGIVRERTGTAMPGVAPSNTYTTADGRYVVIGANSDSLFRRLMTAIDRPDLAEDPALQSNADRAARADVLDRVIGDWCAQRTLNDCLGVLDEAAIPVGPIYSAAEIASDPQYVARGMLERIAVPTGTLLVPGIVPKLSESPGSIRWAGPRLGEHNDEIYGGLLGLDESEQAELKTREVI